MKRVLIVDDNLPSRELIRTVLENSGYEVIEAADGQEGVRLALASQPDLILMDLQMPTLDGFGMLAEIRKNTRFVSLPIVALTANAMQGDREKALEAGFTSYLSKPVALATLRIEIARLLP